jgi:CheY-like chemotaxis protein/HPt (histidine-containing phosphotransfer) domain-containing protein
MPPNDANITTTAEPEVVDAPLSALGNLLADMNHEIRTSMNGVVGMLELLLDTRLTASQQQFATSAQNSVENLLELIEDIVDLSMIESRQLALKHTPFNLLQEMRAACALERAAAVDKGLDLVIEYPAAAMLSGDPARVRRVIASLIDSAIGLAQKGEIAVAGQIDDCAPQHCRLRVTVTVPELDIGDEQLAAILELPIRSSVTALRPHGRTGLELVLCRELANMMGGRIGIDRLPQTGAQFWLTLELPRAATQQAGTRLLLAEDPSAERSALQAQLAAQDLCVDAVNNAAAALTAIAQAAAARTPYRIVILGRSLRDMDAEILGAALARDPRYQDISLVMLGAHGDDAPRLAAAGFSAVLEQPIQPQALLAALNSLHPAKRQEASLRNAGHPIQANAPLAGKRILVADDNPVNQQIAVRMLEKLGCVVEVAGNGLEALELHRATPYALIMMDCQMPELDGYQATEKIRALEEGSARHTPVIALTACTTQDEQEKCVASGMDDFISKPIRPHALSDMLERWLYAPAAQRPAVASQPADDELEVVRGMFGADFVDLARLYQVDSPPRIALLHDAGAAGDEASVAKIAHAFSGSSASIGATTLSALCRDLEISAREGALQDFAQRMALIEAEYGRVCAKLRSMIESEH